MWVQILFVSALIACLVVPMTYSVFPKLVDWLVERFERKKEIDPEPIYVLPDRKVASNKALVSSLHSHRKEMGANLMFDFLVEEIEDNGLTFKEREFVNRLSDRCVKFIIGNLDATY